MEGNPAAAEALGTDRLAEIKCLLPGSEPAAAAWASAAPCGPQQHVSEAKRPRVEPPALKVRRRVQRMAPLHGVVLDALPRLAQAKEPSTSAPGPAGNPAPEMEDPTEDAAALLLELVQPSTSAPAGRSSAAAGPSRREHPWQQQQQQWQQMGPVAMAAPGLLGPLGMAPGFLPLIGNVMARQLGAHDTLLGMAPGLVAAGPGLATLFRPIAAIMPNN